MGLLIDLHNHIKKNQELKKLPGALRILEHICEFLKKNKLQLMRFRGECEHICEFLKENKLQLMRFRGECDNNIKKNQDVMSLLIDLHNHIKKNQELKK